MRHAIPSTPLIMQLEKLSRIQLYLRVVPDSLDFNLSSVGRVVCFSYFIPAAAGGFMQ